MRGSLNNDHRAMTAQAGPARSIYKETFVNHFIPPEVLEESERNNLHRSNSRNVLSIMIFSGPNEHSLVLYFYFVDA